MYKESVFYVMHAFTPVKRRTIVEHADGRTGWGEGGRR